MSAPKHWPKTPQGLHRRAAKVRLDDYVKTGGTSLAAAQLADRLEAEAACVDKSRSQKLR